MLKQLFILFGFLALIGLFHAAPPRTTSSQNDESDDNCSICLASLAVTDNSPLKTLQNCRHSYHRNCIDQWLQESKRCPMCRKEVKIPDELPPDHNDNDDGTYIVIEDGNDDQTNIPIEIGGGIEEIDNPEQADEWEPYDHLLNDSDRESDHSVQISTNVPHENDYESDHSVDISTTNWEGLINSIVGDEDQNHAVGQTQPSDGWQPHEYLLNGLNESEQSVEIPPNESQNANEIVPNLAPINSPDVHVAQDDDVWEPYEHLLNGNDSDHSVIIEPNESQNPTDHQQDGTEGEWESYGHLLNDSDNESNPSVYLSPETSRENISDEHQNSANPSNVESTQAEGEWESYEHLLNVPANESNNISPIPTGDVLSSAEMNGIFYAGAPPLSTLPPDRLQLLEAATVGSSVTVRDNAGSAHTVNVRQL